MPPKTRRHASKDNHDVSSSDEENHAVVNPASMSTTATPTPTTGGNTISMSEEQLTRLLSNVMRSVMTPTPTPSSQAGESTGPTHPTATHTGAPTLTLHSNFTRCTARYDGAARGAETLEAFVESVLIYKECANVSDEHALRGLPMLLTGEAAVWWQGIKSTVETWDDAIRRLRFMYGAPRPAHRILREIFAQEQSDSDSVDSYISRVRANMSRIPYDVPQLMQLDIVYGLLNRKIRKRVSRDSVSSVDCLLERARYVEETLNEVSLPKSLIPPRDNNSNHDHANNIESSTNSRNVNINPPTANVVQNNRSHATPNSSSINSSDANSKRVRPRCAFCKKFGHSVEGCRNKTKSSDINVDNAPLSCYGCGLKGVIRSKCPTCKGTPSADKASFQSAVTHAPDRSHPTVKIGIASLLGVAVLDTGATESLASPGLYKILLDSGTTFTETRRTLSLADGTQQVRELLVCNTNVTIQKRVIPANFLVIPEANNRTLLGQDFIARAGILLDLQHNCWYFRNAPRQKFTFVQSYSLESTSDEELMQIDSSSGEGLLKVDSSNPLLREDEGTKLSPAQRTQLNQLIVCRAERFATDGPPTTYATHRIRVDEKQEPTASPPYRMSQGKKQLLDGELEKLLRADVIEECESPWAANVVLVAKKDGGVRLCVDYRKLNVIADALSRPACCEENPGGCEVCLVTVDVPHRTPDDVRTNQLRDPELKNIVEDLEATDDPFRGRGWSERGYLISDGVLYRCAPDSEDAESACLVVPTHERESVLTDFHDAPTAGHFGAERTLQRIRARYFWPGMRSFVTDYIKRCTACQRYKIDNRKPAGLLQTPAPTRRFEVVSVDLFGPLPRTSKGNRWILILEDTCSHWVELFALENATSVECAEVLISEVFLRFGVPRRMISDNGVQFVAEVMQQACHVMGIKQSLTPLYHPEANPVERKNRDLKPQLAILVGKDHTSWDIHLAAVRFAMNSAVTASTGFSPAFLTFGRELRAPSDVVADMKTIVDGDNFVHNITPYLRKLSTVLLDARDVHERAQSVQKKYADEGRRPPPDYKVGDLVLLKTQGLNDVGPGQSAKFIPRRDGPYRIREVVTPTTYLVEGTVKGEHIGRYHVSDLTPFIGDVEVPVREKRRRGRPRRYDC